MMPLEALKLITEAEDAARSIKAEATARAKQMISDAEKAGEASLRFARQNTEHELAEKRLVQQKQGEEKVSLHSRMLEEQKSGLRSMAQSRLDDAARAIIERIVNG